MTTTSTLITFQTLTRNPNGDMVINYSNTSTGVTLPTDSNGTILQDQALYDYLQVTPWESIIPYYSAPDAVQRPLTPEIEWKIENNALLGVRNHHYVLDYNKKYSTNLTANTDYTINDTSTSVILPPVTWTNIQSNGFDISILTDAPAGYKFYAVTPASTDIPHPTIPDTVAATPIIACSTGSWQLNPSSTNGNVLNPQGIGFPCQPDIANVDPGSPWRGSKGFRFTSLNVDQTDYVCIRPGDGATFWNRYQQPVNQGDTINNSVPSDYAYNSIINSTATTVQYVFVLSGSVQDSGSNVYTQYQMIDTSVSPSLTAITQGIVIKIWK
jgi:hypothetical protein